MMRRSTARRVAIVVALAAVVTYVVATKPGPDIETAVPAPATVSALVVARGAAAETAGLPRLVDLGADTCIPCKAMAPILVELRVEYAGRLQVDFIDVWKDPSAGDPYNIYAIPTQIFYDGNGRELIRHEGFFSKADILATWKRFGFDFAISSAPAPKS
jgi:thioredoxin 1